MEWLLLGLPIWWVGGLLGYRFMRRGFLNKYEKSLGKKEAWDNKGKAVGIVAILITGPFFIPTAFAIHGKRCLKKN